MLQSATISFAMTKAACVLTGRVLCFSSLESSAQHIIAIPKSLSFIAVCQNWPLMSLLVQEEGFGRKVSGIVPVTPQQLPNAPGPSRLVSMVTQCCGELETKPSTYKERSKPTALPCQGIAQEIYTGPGHVRLWEMLDYLPSSCPFCKKPARNQTQLPLLVPSSEKPWEM